MSEIAAELTALLSCLLLLVGVVIAEALWLVRKGWASSGRAIAYALTTDLLGFGIGSFVVLAIFMIMLMLVFGPAGRGSEVPESVYLVTSLIAIVVPPMFLALLKRLFLSVLKIKFGNAAWTYCVVSSFLTILVVLVPPPLLYYLISYSSTWK
jgi:hypothetical protein